MGRGRGVQLPFKAIGIVFVFIILLSARSSFISPATQAATNSVEPNFNTLGNHYLAVNPNPTKEFIDAKAYILVDGSSGNILLDNDGDVPVPIGSTTKMVTALVASLVLPADKIITVGEFAANINGSGIGFMKGEQVSVANLLKALLIQSGNDAAYALAEAYSQEPGNYQKFVIQMNKYAVQHHLNKTNYQDPAGLADEGYSTAFDLAQIGRLLLNNPVLSAIVRTAEATITNESGKTYQLKNTDQLLQNTNSNFNADVIGIKTGFTPLAGYCLVAAENFHEHLLIAVVLGVPGNGETASAKEINKLFSWADQNVTVKSY